MRVSVRGTLPTVAEVTPAAVADLRLTVGSPVWAAVKATEIEIYPGKPHAWFNAAAEWLAVQERMERFLEQRFRIEPAI